MKNSSRVLHRFSVAAVTLMAALSVSQGHAGLPPLEATGAPRMEARFDVLTAKAQVKGTVRIIVRLKEKKSSGTADEQAHKASIARTQAANTGCACQPHQCPQVRNDSVPVDGG